MLSMFRLLVLGGAWENILLAMKEGIGREPTGPAKLMLVDEASRREGTAAVAVAVAAVDTVEKSRPSESRDRRSRLRFFRVPRARPIVVHRHDASTNILPPIRMRVPGRRDVRLASRYCRMLVGDRLRVCLAEVSGLRVVLRTSAFSRPTSFRMSAGLKLHECRSGWRYQEIGTVDKLKWVACMHVMGPCHTADWHVDQPFHHLQAPGKTIEFILLSIFVERVHEFLPTIRWITASRISIPNESWL